MTELLRQRESGGWQRSDTWVDVDHTCHLEVRHTCSVLNTNCNRNTKKGFPRGWEWADFEQLCSTVIGQEIRAQTKKPKNSNVA